MDTKQLKQKILDLAIRGKLVPQDPNDEPASVLLERIRKEKEQLIASGKLKKTKSKTTDTPHYENVPFEIPDSWEWVKLEDVARVIHGKNQTSVENPQGKYPIYGSGGILGYADDYLCPEHCTIVGRKGTINNPILVETKFWNVDTAFGLHPNSAIDYLYFHYFCKDFDFSKLDKSTALPSLTKSTIEQIAIPIPPFNEQKRIVSEIQRWFANIDKIEQNKQDLQEYIKQAKSKVLDLSIHGKLVPQDPNDEPAIELLHRINPHFTSCDTSHYENLPNGWASVMLLDICKIDTGKWDANHASINGKYRFYTCSAQFSYSDTKRFSGECLIIPGNGDIGQVYYYDGDFDAYQRTYVLSHILIYSKYLYYHLLSNWRNVNTDKQFGSTIKFVRIGNFQNYIVLLPPLAEQKRIVERIETIFAQLDTITAEL